MILVDRQRGIRSTKLTQAGEVFYPIAERWRELLGDIEYMQSTISNLSVRLGCIDSVKQLYPC